MTDNAFGRDTLLSISVNECYLDGVVGDLIHQAVVLAHLAAVIVERVLLL